MTQDIPPASLSPSSSVSSRQAPSSFGRGTVETNKRNGSHRHQSPHHQPVDTLIESLDENEEVDVWLNEVMSSMRAQREASSSALQLKVEGEDTGASSSSASSSRRNLTTLESQLSSLSTTLTFSRQDTLAVIDSTISNVNSTIPRLGLELRLMRDAALVLKTSIDQLRQQALNSSSSNAPNGKDSSSSSDSSASATLERLSALSMLHSRMSSARDVLSLAESWSTLSADVTSFLSESKYASACSRLAEAKSSLAVFERTPEYESRKKLLEGLCNSLINSISPSLLEAVKDKDVGESQRIAGVFSGIGREEEFAERWREARLEPWLLQWKKSRSTEEVNSGTGDSSAIQFAQLLPTLLDGLLALLDEERLFAPSLFPKNPRTSVEQFTTATLESLDPPFKARLLQAMKQHDHEALLILVRVDTAVKSAIHGISRAINRVDGGAEASGSKSPLLTANGTNFQHSPTAMSPLDEHKQLGTPSQSPVSPSATRPRQGSHSRRLSHRRLSVPLTTPNTKSSSHSEIQEDLPAPTNSSVKQTPSDILLALLPAPAEWEKRLLDPLIEMQLDYANLERHYLISQAEKESRANEAAARSSVNEASTSALLGSQLGKLLREDCRMARGLAEDATLRNISLTYGLASDDLVSCIDHIFVVIVEKFKTRLEQRSNEVVQFARRKASGKLESALDGHQISSSVEEDQWKAFEESVGLLSTMHQAEQSIEAVERYIAEQIKDVGDMLLNTSSPTAGDAMLRLCGQSTPQGITTAPLAILLRHHLDRLQSSNLTFTLENARLLARETRSTSSLLKRQALLVKAKLALSKQVKTVQHHLIDMALAPLMSYMELYTQLPTWEATRLPGSINEYELTMPTFSLSPTEEMSRIGEGLLDLPRLLEVWSDNGDLRWALRSLPFVVLKEGEDATAKLAEQGDIEAQPTSPLQSNKRMSFHPSSTSPTLDRRLSSHRHTASLAAIATIPASNSTSSTTGDGSIVTSSVEDDSESVLQTYLSSIALTLLSHLTSLVLPSITKLSNAGSSQMVADLEYLLNILSALNVNTNDISSISNASSSQSVYLIRTLEAWKDSCKLKDGEGKRLANFVRSGQLTRGATLTGIEGFSNDEDRLKSLASTQAFDMVGRMRGW